MEKKFPLLKLSWFFFHIKNRHGRNGITWTSKIFSYWISQTHCCFFSPPRSTRGFRRNLPNHFRKLLTGQYKINVITLVQITEFRLYMWLSMSLINDPRAVFFMRWVISSTVGLKEHLFYVFLFVALLPASWSKAKVSAFTWVKNVKYQHFPTQP